MITSGKENPYAAHWQQLGVQVDTWKGHVGTPASYSSASRKCLELLQTQDTGLEGNVIRNSRANGMLFCSPRTYHFTKCLARSVSQLSSA